MLTAWHRALLRSDPVDEKLLAVVSGFEEACCQTDVQLCAERLLKVCRLAPGIRGRNLDLYEQAQRLPISIDALFERGLVPEHRIQGPGGSRRRERAKSGRHKRLPGASRCWIADSGWL